MNSLPKRIKKLILKTDWGTLVEVLKTCYELTESAVPIKISKLMQKQPDELDYNEICSNINRQAIWYGIKSVNSKLDADDWARQSAQKEREFYTKILTVLGA